MNVNFKIIATGVLFFIGAQAVEAQTTKKKDTVVKEKKIDEVVILGYSKTATKPKDVSATTTISADKIENRPNSSVLSSLQGEAPGVFVSTNSGSPGSAKIDLIIRGVSSFTASSDPLYVIDGMMSSSTEFKNLNPSDIESISILKDAAGTSIYGNRGANGVVIINTKRGGFNQRFSVSYNGSIGVSTIPNVDYNMANSQQVLRIQRAANQGQGVGMTDAQIDAYGINTDWRKILFRTGLTQSHDVSMIFGAKNVSNYTSFGYFNQEGTVPNSNFQRFTFRNNLTGKSLNDRFTYRANVALAYSKRNQLDEENNANISNNSIQNPLLAVLTGLPTLDPNKYQTGQQMVNGFGSNFANGEGIYSLLDVLRGNLPNLYTNTAINVNASASYKITDDLTFTNKANVDYKYNERNFARAPWSYLGLIVAKNANTEFGGLESFSKTREFNFQNISSLNYHKVVNDLHTFDVGAYMDYLKVHYNGTAQQQNGLNPLNWVFGAGTGYVPFSSSDPTRYQPSISASQVTAGSLAYFATLDYDYDSKYGFSGLIRRDGSYRFANDKKWGTFWMVSGRWNIDQEDFMKGSTFDMLKLRASYGIQGNQNVIAAAYGTNPLLVGTNLVRDLYGAGMGYNNINASYYNGTLTNPDIQWEEIKQLNIGLDYSLWNKKISGSLDVYDKRTNKLYNPISISWITGTNSINGNNGELQNRGIEASIKYSIINNQNIKWSMFANAAYNKSKILSLLKDDTTGTMRNVTGHIMNEWYVIPYVGVNQANGNLLFLDANNNVTENPNIIADARATGKSYIPTWNGGFGSKFEYKGFFLDANFSFQQGAYRWDNQMSWAYDPTTVKSSNVSADLLNAWTPTNVVTNIPSLTASNVSLDGDSDRFLKDASFIKLKNVSLGYSVPKTMLEGTNIKGLKIYAQAENLYTWTKWKGYDPEPLFSSSVSVYPNLKTISIGVNVDF